MCISLNVEIIPKKEVLSNLINPSALVPSIEIYVRLSLSVEAITEKVFVLAPVLD